MSVRAAYEEHGVEAWYAEHGGDYRNPHEDALTAALHEVVPAWSLPVDDVLDLACGSGEVTLALQALGGVRLTGMDPFTGPAYTARTGLPCEPVRFEDLAAGALDERRWELVVCSYALHLLEPSWLPAVAMALARVTPRLLILTPHKRPELKWGWRLAEERVVQRVRARLYLLG